MSNRLPDGRPNRKEIKRVGAQQARDHRGSDVFALGFASAAFGLFL